MEEQEKPVRAGKRQLKTTIVFMNPVNSEAALKGGLVNSKSCVTSPIRQGKKIIQNQNTKTIRKQNQKGKVKYINESQFSMSEMAAQPSKQ